MKVNVLHFFFVITMICFMMNSLWAQQIIPSPKGSSKLYKEDFTKKDFWEKCPVITEKKSCIVFNLQSTYVKNRVFMKFDITPPEKQKISSIELFIIPELRNNQPRRLLSSMTPRFNLFFTPKGLDTKKSYYDSRGFSSGDNFFESIGNTASLFSKTQVVNNRVNISLAIPVPENSNWTRRNVLPGEYYNIAFRIYLGKHRRPYTFFNNHNGLINKHNMAKLLFCSGNIPENLAFYFDTQQGLKNELTKYNENLDELKKFGDKANVARLAKRMKSWKNNIGQLNESDYRQNRNLLFEQLKKIVEASQDYRNSHLDKIIKSKRQKALAIAVSTDRKDITPDYTPRVNDLKNSRIKIKISPGERSIMSAALWGQNSYDKVTFKLSPLKDRSGNPATIQLDPYWVKCWYQGGNINVTFIHKKLMPELLLKNPDLVQVDYLNKENILSAYQVDGNTRYYPDDAKTLQPLRQMPAGFTQQIWFYVKCAKNAKPGKYNSVLEFRSNSQVIAKLSVSIEVLDIELKQSPLRNYFYTRSLWGKVDEKLVLNEIRTMVEHGIENIGLYERAPYLRRVVELMHRGGLDTSKIYLQGDGDFVFWTDMSNEAVKIRVEKAQNALKGLDYVEDIYFYLPDEASGARLKKKR